MANSQVSSSDALLFNDTFTVTAVNAAKYDRVSRISATTTSGDTIITLDINSEIYPIHTDDNVHLAMTSTLSLDGTKDGEKKGWRPPTLGEMTFADQYDYVCHGKVYRFEEGEGENIKVFVSFGGLLLYMEGPFRKMSPLRIDYVYLLMKK